MGVSSAIIDFNEGAHGVLKVMKEYGLDEGDCYRKFCISRDLNRIKKMDLKCSESALKSRKNHRALPKGFDDAEKEKEGVTYGPGMYEFLSD